MKANGMERSVLRVIEDMNPEISEWGQGRVIFFDTVLFEDFGEPYRQQLDYV
jgi:hypothetical protein